MNPDADMRYARLSPIIETYRRLPFAWSIHDCVLFAARCVDAQLATQFETFVQRDFKYEGPVSALRIVKDAGGWEPLISRYLGPSVGPEQLTFGDVVLGHNEPPRERTTLMGICDEELFIAPGAFELEWLPMTNAIRGWKLDRIPR
jgi:hypothetical protein